MKLQLSAEWFDKHIRPEDDFDIGAGAPGDAESRCEETSECESDDAAPEQASDANDQVDRVHHRSE